MTSGILWPGLSWLGQQEKAALVCKIKTHTDAKRHFESSCRSNILQGKILGSPSFEGERWGFGVSQLPDGR